MNQKPRYNWWKCWCGPFQNSFAFVPANVWLHITHEWSIIVKIVLNSVKVNDNKAKRGFGPLARATKPSETAAVHQSSHPSKF